MRFDVVVNNLAGLAWTTREIRLTSDGSPWRPLVHVLDICEAVACVLDAPRQQVHGQIYNVGDSAENYQVRDIARIVADTFPGCQLTVGKSDGDNRSYRVQFDKIREHLPAFHPRWNVPLGVQQLRARFEQIGMSEELFRDRHFTRLRQLEHLQQSGQVDDRLFWTEKAAVVAVA
jgi:nucleoside-diphosphate-sugar epimerase